MEEQLEEMKQERRKYRVPAVDTAFKIVTLLSRKKFYKSNLSEIAKALSLTPTTCYRILRQLEELSIVRYDKSSKRYSLGPYLVVLGERAKENLFDISVILPYLEILSEKTGLTSVLVNRIGETRSTIVAKVEGGDFGINVSIGRHFSVVDGAYGKCLLAYMDEGESDELLKTKKGLRTISDQEINQLKSEFPIIRKNGYSTTFGEYISGIFGVAAPIFNNVEKVETVICLFGMTAQCEEHELALKGEMLKSVANDISTKISGYGQ
jgi:DNA-binding IclR family transcriptional regulator